MTHLAPPPPPPPPPPERVLLRFGAFGVGITYGRPSLWAWTHNNTMEVVVTDRRVCGVWNPSVVRTFFSSRRGQVQFEVPLAAVTRLELVPFLGRKAVYLAWQESGATREVSIEGGLGFQADVLRLHQLLTKLLGAGAG